MHKIVWLSMMVVLVAVVVVSNPLGLRCEYEKECVPIKLSE